METTEAIDRFDGKHSFLSNFHPSPVIVHGQTFATVEHAFQAAKTTDWKHRQAIRQATTPGRAKRLGRRAPLREDWEAIKIDVMEALLRQKFKPGSELHRQLKATAPKMLIEGNTWGDTFWGAVPVFEQVVDHKWVGQNWLGILLMKIRDEDGA